jgi:para-nitrobenzyl esterase
MGFDRRTLLLYTARAAGLLAAGAILPRGLGARHALAADLPSTEPVEIRSGRIRGKLVDGVNSFLGVPYGAPTGGARRFLAPLREAPWTGLRDAFEWGPYAPQSGRARGTKQLEFWTPLRPASTKGESEDCLYLNVWTRGLGDRGKRPVMVWLHGGGYDQGSGGSTGYSGADLARDHDVVGVSINHRLNVLGYLYLGEILGGEFAASANPGQQDIVAALAWVRDNVEAFGGDPGRVMIYGQSGGAGKVVNVMGMPSAQGLFHAAGVQSGGARGGDKSGATESALRLLEAFGLTKDRARELQQVPLDRLMMVAAGARNAAAPPSAAGSDRAAESPERLAFRWGPVVDGAVIPEDPNASPLSKDVPVIVGATRTERTIYEVDGAGFGRLTEEELVANVTELVGADQAEAVIASYRREKPRASPYALDCYIATDVRAPGSLAAARNARKQAPTWVYRWDWETPVMDLLAPHTMEIPFVMSHLDDCVAMAGPVTDAMRELEARASGAWVALAAGGNPNHRGLPQWPAYTDGEKAVMLFDTPCRVENDPGAKLRALLLPGAAERQRGPFGGPA